MQAMDDKAVRPALGTMHLITSFTANAGAETMLARIVRQGSPDPVDIVSLRGISERNRALAGHGAGFTALNVSGPVGLGKAVAQLAWRLRTKPPARILCWMYHAMVVGSVAARLVGYRGQVFWLVRQSLDDPESLSASTRRAIDIAARMSGGPDGIVYNSARARDLHHARGFSARRDAVVPNGFVMPSFTPPAHPTPQVLGIAARFHPQKDYPTFLHAAARVADRHPAVRFAVAGAGTEGADFDQLVAQAGLPPDRLLRLGQVEDMNTFYHAIDALVLSSRTEGFPNVVGEAMSHGRPVISTDVGDAAAIVGETGFTVPPADPAALTEAMLRMIDLTPADYAARCAAARLRIQKEYDISTITQRLSDFVGQPQ